MWSSERAELSFLEEGGSFSPAPPAYDESVCTAEIAEIRLKRRKRTPAERLPPGLPPRCLSVTEAAAYLGMGNLLFEKLVRKGVLPQGLQLMGWKVWDRVALDLAVDRLSGLLSGESLGRTNAPSPAAQSILEAIDGAL